MGDGGTGCWCGGGEVTGLFWWSISTGILTARSPKYRREEFTADDLLIRRSLSIALQGHTLGDHDGTGDVASVSQNAFAVSPGLDKWRLPKRWQGAGAGLMMKKARRMPAMAMAVVLPVATLPQLSGEYQPLRHRDFPPLMLASNDRCHMADVRRAARLIVLKTRHHAKRLAVVYRRSLSSAHAELPVT